MLEGRWGSVVLLVCGSVDSWPISGVGMAWRAGVFALWGHVGQAVGFAWCGSAEAVSGHRFCPIFLAVALSVGRFLKDTLLEPD